jgi:phosphoglycolate phosphatase
MSDTLHVAFDLDGTLVDTAPDLVRALNAAILPEGLPAVPVEAVRAMVGRGAKALIREAYARAGMSELDPERLDARLDVFMDVYRGGIAELSRPFPGVIDALDTLAETGARLSVCTNKPSALAVALLDALALADRFDRIIGPEDAPAKKPDPSHLLAAFGGVLPTRAVLVGDSEPDALAARAAGARLVLYRRGYSEKPVEGFAPDRLLEHYADLNALLDGLWTDGRTHA